MDDNPYQAPQAEIDEGQSRAPRRDDGLMILGLFLLVTGTILFFRADEYGPAVNPAAVMGIAMLVGGLAMAVRAVISSAD